MKREQGFSLAELLIALAVTAILIVLLGSVVSATLTSWQQGRNRLDTFSNARQVIGRMADELSAAIAIRDRIEFVENSGSLGGNPPTPKISESVFFVAPYPNSGSGDLCVIAYRHNVTERRLERAFKNSAEAWSPGAATRYRAGGYTSGTNGLTWRTVANGVLEFELRSYSQQNLDNGQEYDDAGSPIVESWNSGAVGNATMEGKPPRRIVLRLKVVDDRTLTRLATLPVNSAAYRRVVQEGARDFFADFRLVSR